MAFRINILSIIFLLLCCVANARSQDDSLTYGEVLRADSLPTFYKAIDEDRLEQVPEDEESPLLDLVEDAFTHNDHVNIRSRLIHQFQKPAGYRDGVYRGSVLKSYQRVLIQQGCVSAGVLATKDPGEVRVDDFLTGNALYRSDGLISRAVVGDYRIECGQGIALWRGFEFGKGIDIEASAVKRPRGIVASLSSDEAKYFHGAAATLNMGTLSSTLFFSHRMLNGTADSEGNISSFYNSGYFRTPSERLKRDKFRENVFGGHFTIALNRLGEIGLTAVRSEFGKKLSLDEGKRFSGDNYSLYSIDYDIRISHLRLFGEGAVTNSVVGGLTGVQIQPSKEAYVLAAARLYSRRFLNLNGLGFSARPGNSNENGLYFGVHLRLSRSVRVSASLDQFWIPEQSASTGFASGSNDILIQLESTSIRKLQIMLRYDQATGKHKELVAMESGLIGSRTFQAHTHRIRFQTEYHISPAARLRNRIEKIVWDGHSSLAPEKGILLYTDVILQIAQRILADLRVSCFQTDSYSSRGSLLERDLEGAVTVQSLYGRGVRWYLFARYDVGNHLTVAAKYSELIRDDVRHLGTGADELPSNHDNRLGVQVDIFF